MAPASPGRKQTIWTTIAGIFRNRSLRNKIILTFLLVTLLSIGGITYVNNRATSERLTEQAGNNLEELAAARALNIGTMISRNIDALQSFSLGTNVANKVAVQNNIYAGQYDNEWAVRSALRERDTEWQTAEEGDAIKRARLQNILARDLREFAENFPSISDLVVTDKYGGLIAASFESSDYYQGDETWWQNTYNRGNGTVFISDPQLHPGGRRIIRVAVPVYDDVETETGEGTERETIGVIGGLLDTVALADTLSNTDVGQTGSAELMFQTSSYVFGPRDGDYTFYSTSEPGAEPMASFKRAPRGNTQMTLFGRESFVANAPITSLEDHSYIDKLGWQVIVHQDKSEALQVVDETTRNTSLLAAAIAAIVIFVGVVMGQHFARPILTLSEAMTRFTSGDLSTRVHIKTGDETGTLAQHFNEMADQMSSLFQRLEDRRNELEQRTRQLDANQRAISVIFAASKQSGPEELLGLVVDMIRDQFDLYHVQIYMVDEAGETAILREGTGYAGRQLMQQNHSIALDQPALVSRAITQDEPVIVEDVEEAEDFLANPLLPDTQSELVVPLRLGNQVIGALDVQSNGTNKFNRDMITLFQTMAEQIAFLFENSQLLEQVSEQNEALTRFTTQLRAAAELGQRLGAIYEPDELLHETVELIQSRFGFYHVHIYLLQPQKGELVVRAGSGEVGRVLREKEHSIPINATKSLVASAANNADTVLVNDVSLESDFLPNPLLPQTRSEVAVPLVVRGEVLGVLDVQDDQAERFNDSDVNALNTLAGQVATALNSARLFEQLQNTLEQTRIRLKANEALSTTRTEKEVLDVILDQASLYEGVQVTLFLIDETDESEAFFEIYESRALRSGLAELRTGQRFGIEELALEGFAFDEATFTSRNAFEDDRVSDGVRRLMERAGATSIAVTRIQIGDDWFGTLTITSPEEQHFDQHRIRLYELLAERGALALREARLREQLTRIGQAIENTSDAVVISDIRGEAVYKNRAFTDLFGYTLEELNESGGAAALYRSEDDAQRIFEEAVSGGSWTGELDMKSKAGNVVPVELHVDAFRDDEGNVVGAIGTMTDITERRTLREAGAVVAATLQRDEAIDRILDQLDRVVEHDSASVQLLYDDYIEIVGGKGWRQSDEEIIGLQFPIPGDNPNTVIVQERRPVVLNSPQEIAEYPSFGEAPHVHIQSWMGVPLMFRDRVIGMLAMESAQKNAFSPNDAQVVSAFGVHVAVAIENSRLFEQTESTLARNRAMLDAIPDTMFRFDRNGVYLDVNAPEWEKLVAPKEEVIGKPLTEVLPPFVAEPAVEAIADAIETGELQTFEYSLPLEDGVSHFEARIARINANEVLAMVRDITDRREAQRTQERLTAILEATTDFVSIADANGNMLYLNAAGHEMVGLDQDTDITDLHISDFRPVDALEEDEAFQTVLSEGVWRGESVLQYKGRGEPIPVSQVGIAHRTDDGELQYISTIARDISEQKQSEEELKHFAGQLRTAAEITEQLSTVLDPDELLQDVVDVLKSRFALYHVHVYLLDDEQKNLIMSAGSGEVGQKLRERGHSIPLAREKSLVARAAREHVTVHVDDTRNEPDFMANPLLPDTRSEVAVPLVSRGELVGVLDVQDNKAHRFSETEIDTLNTIAGQIATAIQNARLFEQTERALRESDIRVRVNEALAEVRTEQAVVDTIIEEAGLYQDAQVTVFLTEETDEEEYVVVHGSNSFESGLESLPIGMRFAVSDHPTSKYTQDTDIFITDNAFEDERIDEGIRTAMRQSGSVSMAIIQMRIGDRWLGSISATSPDEGYFDEDKAKLYQILAERSAVALREARLFEQTEEALENLRMSEAQNRAMLEAVPDMMFRFDRNGTYLDLHVPNDEKLIAPPEEVLGKPLTEVFPPTIAEPAIEAIEAATETGEMQEFEYSIPLGETTEYFEARVAAINEDEVLTMVRDITEQKEAREALRESEERFRFLSEETTEGVFVHDKGTFIDVNEAGARMFGYDRSELIGQNALMLTSDESREIVKQNMLSDSTEPYEAEGRRKDGSRIVAQLQGKPAVYQGREVRVALIRDITQQKEAQEEMRRLNTMLVTQHETSPDGILIVNPDREFVFYNQRFTEIWHIPDTILETGSSEDALEHVRTQLKHPDEFVERSNELYTSRERSREEIELKDGRILDRFSAPMVGDDGTYYGRMWTFRDITERKQAERELENQRAFLREVLDLNPHFIFAKDRQGRFTLTNKALADAYGTTPSDLVGKTDADFSATDEEAAHFQEDDLRVIENREEVFIPEERITDVEGNERWLQTTKIPLIEHGEVTQLLGVSVDITERKQAEEALRESEVRNRALVDAIPDLMYRLDKNGTFLDVETPSHHAEHYFYLPPEELLQQSVSDVFPFDVSEKIMHHVEQTIETGDIQRFEYQLPIGEGVYDMRDFEARFVVADNNEILAIVRDITEQKAAQKREQRLTEILEATPDFVSIADAEGRPLYLNEAGREMVGLDSDEDISATRMPQFHPDDAHDIVQNAIQTALREGMWRGENVLQGRNGDRIPLSQVLIGHTSEQSGEVEYFSTIARDISDIKEAEEAMAKRLQYEEKLAAASQTLLSGEDIDESMHDVLEHLRVASGSSRVYFYRNIKSSKEGSYAKQTHEACAPHVEPQIDNQAFQQYSYEDTGFGDWAKTMAQGELVAGTIDDFQGQRRQILERQDIKSILLLPIITSEGWYGSIGFNDTEEKREWSPEDIRLLRTAAEMISNAIDRHQATENLERTATQLRTAADVSEQLSAILDPDVLLPKVVAQLQERFDLYHVHIYLVDDEGTDLIMQAGSGEVGQKLYEQNHKIAVDHEQSIVARAARTQEAILVEDTNDDPNFLPNPLLPDTRSEVAVPIIARGDLLGVFDVQDNVARRFTQSDLDVFNTLAGQIASALENARLFEQVQKNLEQTRIRFRVSQTLADTQTVDEALDAIISEAGFYPEAHVSIATRVPDAEQKTFEVRRSASFESGVQSIPEGFTFTEEDFPLLRETTAHEEFIASDLESDFGAVDETTIAFAQNMGAKSVAVLPITYHNEWIGNITVISGEAGFFDDHKTLYLYQSLAEQGAVALHTARLFEEIQQTAERLREVDRLKSEFLANMSHELRTPLNSIIGYAEIMLMGIDGELDDETLQDVQAIHENGQHLLELINDILDLAKIEAGRMKLDKEPVQIDTLFEEVKTSHLGVLHQQKKNLNLEIEVEGELPPVNADYSRLNQVLNNLVSNAIKFTDEGKIVMRATKDNGWLRVEVEDSGVGISQADQRRIFERFRQVDGSSTRAAEGTGLGLAITHHLVEMHGGTIDVESELGEGATFTVRLPIHTEAGEDAASE